MRRLLQLPACSLAIVALAIGCGGDTSSDNSTGPGGSGGASAGGSGGSGGSVGEGGTGGGAGGAGAIGGTGGHDATGGTGGAGGTGATGGTGGTGATGGMGGTGGTGGTGATGGTGGVPGDCTGVIGVVSGGSVVAQFEEPNPNAGPVMMGGIAYDDGYTYVGGGVPWFLYRIDALSLGTGAAVRIGGAATNDDPTRSMQNFSLLDHRLIGCPSGFTGRWVVHSVDLQTGVETIEEDLSGDGGGFMACQATHTSGIQAFASGRDDQDVIVRSRDSSGAWRERARVQGGQGVVASDNTGDEVYLAHVLREGGSGVLTVSRLDAETGIDETETSFEAADVTLGSAVAGDGFVAVAFADGRDTRILVKRDGVWSDGGIVPGSQGTASKFRQIVLAPGGRLYFVGGTPSGATILLEGDLLSTPVAWRTVMTANGRPGGIASGPGFIDVAVSSPKTRVGECRAMIVVRSVEGVDY